MEIVDQTAPFVKPLTTYPEENLLQAAAAVNYPSNDFRIQSANC